MNDAPADAQQQATGLPRPGEDAAANATALVAADLAQLVARARSGDRDAFDALHRGFAPMVHAVALSGAGPHRADDVVQETFVAAWRGLAGLRAEDCIGPWLAAIARRKAVEATRRPVATPIPEHAAGADRERWQGREILAIVLRLPAAYRETLVMRLVEGMTGPEIAARTGHTHGSVRVNLTRGMKLLRAALEHEGFR